MSTALVAVVEERHVEASDVSDAERPEPEHQAVKCDERGDSDDGRAFAVAVQAIFIYTQYPR